MMAVDEKWLRTSYNVHCLSKTLQMIKWDYSAMKREDELEYITEKMKFLNSTLRSDEYIYLPQMIQTGQKLLRNYAEEHLLHQGESKENAEKRSSCTVSQRDIKRVFDMYSWILKLFQECSRHTDDNNLKRNIRALFVSCAVVYYFRLNTKYRIRFEEEINSTHKIGANFGLIFKEVIKEEIDWLMSKMQISPRIAHTNALRENIYAIVICTMSRLPLIIVGPPGSSKTISFRIVVSNFQGSASKTEEFRKKIFKIFDPYPYQCSKSSSSKEIELVFDRAINRQETLQRAGIDCCSVVLLDEAGLPEEKRESLKALHYFLDRPKVSSIIHVYKKFILYIIM